METSFKVFVTVDWIFTKLHLSKAHVCDGEVLVFILASCATLLVNLTLLRAKVRQKATLSQENDQFVLFGVIITFGAARGHFVVELKAGVGRYS